MIFKLDHLLGIKAGRITLAFRKWAKPGVKAGSTMRNELGVIKIEAVELVTLRSITDAAARKAGYDSRDDVLKALGKVEKGRIYKVRLAYESADPRISLRQQASLPDEEFARLKKKLERLDISAGGPWTLKFLRLIRKHPERRAGDLAEMLKMEKLDFKLNVRKLKNLGLTVSHEVGYSISPLGEWVMDKRS
jgi:hypothetical protein